MNARSDADGVGIIYNLIWNGTNTLGTPLTYTVYKTEEKIDASVSCERITETENGVTKYFEECTKSNIEALGGVVGSGTIPANIDTETKVNLVINEEISATVAGTKAYYYVVLEYPNLDEPQNADMGGSFSGIVTTEILGEKETPVVTSNVVESTEASNGWYSSVTLSYTASNSNNTVSAINSCITTEEECTPVESRTRSIGITKTVVLNESNSKPQKACFQGIDTKGLKGNIVCSNSYLIDNTSTTTSITLNNSSVLGNNNWYKKALLDITGNNEISGIESIKYCITELEACDPITVLNETSIELESSKIAQRVCAISTSTSGTTSGVECSALYSVDKEIPTIELTENIVAGSNGWSTSAKITASASDEISGVTGILYCTTTGDTCNPTNEVSETTYEFVMEDNTEPTRVCFASIDITGNISDTKCSEKYLVDSTTPIITSQPSDVVTIVGDGTVYFTIAATGNDISYKWQYYSKTSNSWVDSAATGYNTNRLQMPSESIYNGRKFRCIITSASGATVISNEVTLTVKTKIELPSQSNTLIYTGNSLTPTWNNYSSSSITIGGTTSGIDAGEYTATFTPTSNYVWSDGTSDTKQVSWSIGKAEGSISISPVTLSMVQGNSENVTVTRSGNGTVTASSNNTSVANVSVSGTTVTVTGKSAGSATITINVADSTNYKAVNTTLEVTIKKSEVELSYVTISNANYNNYCSSQISTDGGSTWSDITFASSGTVTVPVGAQLKVNYTGTSVAYGCGINICSSSSCATNASSSTVCSYNSAYVFGTKSSIYTIQDTDTHYSLSYCSCLTGNTFVFVRDKKGRKKKKKIDEVEEGDMIYIFDEVTGKEIIKKVSKIHRSKVNLIYKLTLSNNEIIECSSHHTFMTNMGAMLVDELKVGYELKNMNNEVVTIKNIEIINYNEGIEVYNLSFEGNTNKIYYIGSAMILTFGVILTSSQFSSIAKSERKDIRLAITY